MKPCFSSAMPRTSSSNGKFAHTRCMLWIPTMHEKGRGENSVYLGKYHVNVCSSLHCNDFVLVTSHGDHGRCFEGLDNIEDHQRGKRCCVCRSNDGTCVACAAEGCATCFHPYCGLRAGFSHVAANASANGVRRQAFCLHHSRRKPGGKTMASPAQVGALSHGSSSRQHVTPCQTSTNVRKPTKSKRLRHKLGKHLPPSCKTPVHNTAIKSATRSIATHSQLSSNAFVGRRLQRWSWSLMRVVHGTVCSWSSAKQLFSVQYDIGGSDRRDSATPSGHTSPKSCNDGCLEYFTRGKLLEMLRFKPEKAGRGLRFAASCLSSLQLARLLAFVEEIGASFDAVISKHTTYVITRADASIGSASRGVAAGGDASRSSREHNWGEDDLEIVYKSFVKTACLRKATSLGIPIVAFQWVHACCIGTKLDPGLGKQACVVSEVQIVPVLPFVTPLAPEPFSSMNADTPTTSNPVAKPKLSPSELMRIPLQRLATSGSANAGMVVKSNFPTAVGMDKVGCSEVACPGSNQFASMLSDRR